MILKGMKLVTGFLVLFFAIPMSAFAQNEQSYECHFKADDAHFLKNSDSAEGFTFGLEFSYTSRKFNFFEIDIPVGGELFKKEKYFKEIGKIQSIEGKKFDVKPIRADVIVGPEVIVFEYRNGGLLNIVRLFLDDGKSKATWFDSGSGIAFVGSCK